LARDNQRVAAIVLAAGKSTRMNGIDKLLYPLASIPTICWSLRTLETSSLVDNIVLVLPKDRNSDIESISRKASPTKLTTICDGGPSRFQSVLKGLLSTGPGYGWALIHDGARPFISKGVIKRGLAVARSKGSAIAALPATDSVKVCDDKRRIIDERPRTKMWLAQTPQICGFTMLLESYQKQLPCADELTDEASVLYAAGFQPHVFEGSPTNLKLTTRADLELAQDIATHLSNDSDKRG